MLFETGYGTEELEGTIELLEAPVPDENGPEAEETDGDGVK